MKLKAALVAAFAFATPAMADITIEDAYARSSGMMAKSAAAFLTIQNTGNEADRLIDAQSDIAKITELHTHKNMGDGVMKMVHVPEGFEVPAHGKHVLARGGDHVMFMGLLKPMGDGDTVTVTLTFEKAGDITVKIPVDMNRGADAAMPMGKDAVDHSKMDH